MQQNTQTCITKLLLPARSLLFDTIRDQSEQHISKNREKPHQGLLGVQPQRTNTMSQSNIASSALDAGAPLSIPLAEMSNFRIQTDKATRQHSTRGPLPTLATSWTAQTNRDNAVEDVQGTRRPLPDPSGRSTKADNMPNGDDLSTTTPGEVPPPIRNKHIIIRHITKHHSEKHRQYPNETPTENSVTHLTNMIIEYVKN